MRASRGIVLPIHILGSCGAFNVTLLQLYQGEKTGIYGAGWAVVVMWRRKYFLLQGIEPGFLVHPLKPVHTDFRK
jgi:hypothetical protein